MESDQEQLNVPNFLVIGAARSGTTSLHGLLIQHPDIYLPVKKQPEPHFFLKTDEYSKGYQYYLDTYFNGVKEESAVGEISTSYLFGEQVPQRIHDFKSDIKLICMLRDPVKRAFSNYWHSTKNGFETLSFREAVDQAEERHLQLGPKMKEIAPFAYIERGLYGDQLTNYLNYFKREQLHIIIMEEFFRDLETGMKRLFEFLEVDPAFVPNKMKLDTNKSVPETVFLSTNDIEMISPYFRKSNEVLFELLGRVPQDWI